MILALVAGPSTGTVPTLSGSAGNGPPTSRRALWRQGALVPLHSLHSVKIVTRPFQCHAADQESSACPLVIETIQPSNRTLSGTHQSLAPGRTACCRAFCSPKARWLLEAGRNSCLCAFAQLYVRIKNDSKFINKCISAPEVLD